MKVKCRALAVLLLVGQICFAKTYDWQHQTIYKKPDYKKFFKKNSTMTMQLHKIAYSVDPLEGKDDREIFKIFREGVRLADKRNAYKSLKWLSYKYAREGNPEAIEIFYHLLDTTVKGEKAEFMHVASLCYGFSRFKEYTPNLLRTFVDICMTYPKSKREEYVLRNTKSFYPEMIKYLKKPLRSRNKDQKDRALRLKEIFETEADVEEKRPRKRMQSRRSKRPRHFTYREEQDGESSYMASFRDLYNKLGKYSANVRIKDIDWDTVWDELSPQVAKLKNKGQRRAFGLLCKQLIAKLQDSHARLMDGTQDVPQIKQWTSGFHCLKDANNDIIIYHVSRNTDAYKKKLQPGMKIISINNIPVNNALSIKKKELSTYSGFSTPQCLEAISLRHFGSSFEQNTKFELDVEDCNGKQKKVTIKAAKLLTNHYVPRLPIVVRGINDGTSKSVQWKRMGKLGYIFIRRMQKDLVAGLNKAVKALKKCEGIIIDVRANVGGHTFKGFHANFGGKYGTKKTVSYDGPLVLLIGPQCASAGEIWASWFIANNKAKIFGSTTAGTSGHKKVIELKNKFYKVLFVSRTKKVYHGEVLEGIGLSPGIEMYQKRQDIIDKKDTVLEAAKIYLTSPSDFNENGYVHN